MGAENNPQYKKRDVPNQSLREGVPPRSEPIPQQPKQPEQTLPQQEGVVDELTRVLGERGNNLIFEAHLREAVRQLAQIYYKKAPSREVIARRNEEERKLLETLTPEEKAQFYKQQHLRDIKNLRHTSDQIDSLGTLRPDYVADLQQQDPEFMDPLISALRQRPEWQKKEKAMERLERLRRRRMK